MNSIIIMLAVVLIVVLMRIQSNKKPIKGRGFSFLFLPIVMLIGFIGFKDPKVHVNTMEFVTAACLGIVFAIPLILTTNYEVRNDGEIYSKQSMAYIIALIALVIVRLLLSRYMKNIDPSNLFVLNYTFAYCYFGSWRIASFIKFRKLFILQPRTTTNL